MFPRDVDQVHDMMDDIAEQQDVAKEISEAISNPVAFGQDVDEVSLEVSFSKAPNRIGCFLPHLRMETGPVSLMLCFIAFRIWDNRQSPKNQ
jgi:hypothetical protein